jgi:hypothetical protein
MKTLSLQSNTLRFALTGFLGAAAIISAPGQALAINPITVTGHSNPAKNGQYTISYITGTWAAVKTQLTPQMWWGDSNLAGSLAGALMGSGVIPPGAGTSPILNMFQNSGAGPMLTSNLFFATDEATIFPPANIAVVNGQTSLSPFNGSALNFQVMQSASYNWAVATFVPAPGAPVPGPLPLVGAAAAFGFSRRLRSRINKSANA